jgi:hypothetical protein
LQSLTGLSWRLGEGKRRGKGRALLERRWRGEGCAAPRCPFHRAWCARSQRTLERGSAVPSARGSLCATHFTACVVPLSSVRARVVCAPPAPAARLGLGLIAWRPYPGLPALARPSNCSRFRPSPHSSSSTLSTDSIASCTLILSLSTPLSLCICLSSLSLSLARSLARSLHIVSYLK